MTDAQTGLRQALARAGGSVVAIAEMQTDEIIAGLSDDQRTALAAALAPTSSAESMKPNKENCSEDGDEDDKEGDTDPGMKKGKSEASASGAGAADNRIKAVAAAVETDPACKGKAGLALQMLADDDYAGLSASGIVKLLGKQNVAEPACAGADAEAAARAEMRAAIAQTGNSNIDSTATDSTAKADAGSLWGGVYARTFPNQRP